jgi:hypothetical protein
MIDIGSINNHLHPGPIKDKIDTLQTMGRRLSGRINAAFNLIGRRALQFEAPDGQGYQALIHNEADDATDYLVIHPSGIHEHCFEAIKVEDEWVTLYVDRDVFDGIISGVGNVILEFANEAYKQFVQKNEGYEPEPLTEEDIDLDTFSGEVSHRKMMLSHQGNMRLAF